MKTNKFKNSLLCIICGDFLLKSYPVHAGNLPDSPLKRLQLKAPFTVIYQVNTQITHGSRAYTNASNADIVTLSANNNVLLYIRKNTVTKSETVVIIDGGKTTVSASNSHIAKITPGLDAEDIGEAIIPGVGLPYIPLMDGGLPMAKLRPALQSRLDHFVQNERIYLTKRNYKLSATSRDFGAVPAPFSLPIENRIFYVGGSAVTTLQDGKPKVLSLTTMDPDIPDNVWQFTQHQKFEGVWLASEFLYSRYENINHQHKLLYTSEYKLVQASLSPLTDEEYQISHYLKSGQAINDFTIESPIAYPYNPSDGSLNRQLQRQQILNAEMKSRAEHGNISSRSNSGAYLMIALLLAGSGFTFWKYRSKSTP